MTQAVAQFALPDTLPGTTEELEALLTTALNELNFVQARARRGEQFNDEDVTYLRDLIAGRDTLRTEIASIQAAEATHRQELANLLEQAADTPPAPPEGATNGPPPVAPTVEAAPAVAATEAVVETPAAPAANPDPPQAVAAGADLRPVVVSGLPSNDLPDNPAGPGWQMRVGAPGYVPEPVGFAHIGKALAETPRGSRKMRGTTAQSRGSHMAQFLAGLRRDLPLVEDEHALVAAIQLQTQTLPERRGSKTRVPVTAQALVAAGGWCSPSETLYDFCDVPAATDLISVPEITIVRGGVRWPVEPDLSDIFQNFQFFYSEPELEITDVDGFPAARKDCVEIPCATEFEEMRLNVVGYCVEAGILQTQGWPELITWFTQMLVAEHLRAISRRTILDMVAGSTLETFSGSFTIGVAGAVINSMSLMAMNLRLSRGLSRSAAIEAVAPSWLYEAIRADVAYYQGLDSKAVGDAEIEGWFAARHIFIQLVGDWQTRGTGQPGNLATVTWPNSVDILMYPAGTWFRAMQNVIELGVMYPKEELSQNRYTRMFTEDAIAVASRCYPSVVVRIPINVNGGVGNRYTLASTSYTASSGNPMSGAPVSGGAVDYTEGNTYTLSITGGVPTSGYIVLAVDGNVSAHIAWNATGLEVAEGLQGIEGYTAADFFVTSYASGIGAGTLPTDVLYITVPINAVLTVSSSNLNSGTASVQAA